MDTQILSPEEVNTALARFNLKRNPFEAFELFELGVPKEVLMKHEILFQNREELINNIYYGVLTKMSHRVVLHGDVGVGKSSVLNKSLQLLSKAGFFILKYRVSTTIQGPKEFEREFLQGFGQAITEEAIHNTSVFKAIRNLFKAKTKHSLEEVAMLSLLYAADQITITNQRIKTGGFSSRVGIPTIIGGELTKEESELVEITKTETLSTVTFRDIIQRGINLLKKWGYRGTVIGFDEMDKLIDPRLENALVTLLKDVFYTYSGLAHVIIVLKTRNGFKLIHPDVFNYLSVQAPSRTHVLKFLEILYQYAAIDPKIPFTNIVGPTVIFELYDKHDGSVRFILESLSNTLLSILPNKKVVKIDENAYLLGKISEMRDYVLMLEPTDVEFKILEYLLANTETWVRDPSLRKFSKHKKSKLAYGLRNLYRRTILKEKPRGRKKIYSIEPALFETIKSTVQLRVGRN